MGVVVRYLPFVKTLFVAAMMSAIWMGYAAEATAPDQRTNAADQDVGAKRNRAFLDTSFGQVHYLTMGSGDPVILLHQTPSSMHQYAEMMPLLARSKRVIAMDSLGFGDSDKPAKQLSVEEYGAIVVQLMDKLNIRKASIVGYHTGAFIGIEVASAHPERVDKLVLFEPVYIDDQVREYLRQFIRTEFKPFELKPDGAHLVERWQQIRKTFPQMSLELVNQDVIDNMKSGKGSGAGRTLVMNYPMEKRLSKIQASTLVVWGNRVLPGFPEENKLKVSEEIPRDRVFHFDGIPNLRMHADKFAPLILDFLRHPGV